jgi:uncharacterized protein
MNDEVLETFIKEYISSQPTPEVHFVWQGGEPTLLGIPYYEKVIDFQKKHNKSKKISNSIQTNGTIIDHDWCRFLKKHNFIVGVSLDGPKEIHDRYRVGHENEATHKNVEEAIKLLQHYNIEYNVLVCVTNESSKKPLEVYRYLKEIGVKYIQFTPIVERYPDIEDRSVGFIHASPKTKILEDQEKMVTPYSVRQGAYGKFLIEVFEDWVRHDVGKTFVMNFEWALESWLGLPSTVCIFSKQCGKALAIEHNGDIYSCDHYVYPENHLGNILQDSPLELLKSDFQINFGESKETSLPLECQHCEVKFACNGECPRHRFVKSFDGEGNLSYLCPDYKSYFRHIHRYMKVMVQLIENNLPASDVMKVIEGPLVIYD